MYGYVAHLCILFKVIHVCVQVNVATCVQASSRFIDFSVYDMRVTRVSHACACCVELVANLYLIV